MDPLHKFTIIIATSLLIHTANSHARTPKDEDFRQGIGFYVDSGDGLLSPLTWTVSNLQDQREINKRLVHVTGKSEIFCYGLDFSTSVLPPHLLGFKWGYQGIGGPTQRDWAVRFAPIKGLREKTYTMLFDGPLGELASGSIPCQYWYLSCPNSASGLGGSSFFVFSFGDPAARSAEAKMKRDRIVGYLKEGKGGYEGTVGLPLGINIGSVRKFSIRFESVDADAGKFVAKSDDFFAAAKTMSGKIIEDGISLSWREDNSDIELIMNWNGAEFNGTLQSFLSVPVTISSTRRSSEVAEKVNSAPSPASPSSSEALIEDESGNGNPSPSPASSPELSDFAGEKHPETRSRLMTADDVKTWSKEEIQFSINEIYARYGLLFRDERTRRLFLTKPWYHPNASMSMEEIERKLSDIERTNLKLLGDIRNGR